eukprot:12650370-Alexandrium_andersonii.AAC.1
MCIRDRDTPAALRPLQIPSCWRRIVGATLAAVLGPLLEPRLSPMQSAIRGGDCSRNIRRAFRHLGSSPRAAT